MWRRVAHVRTDVSEDSIACVMWMERISELGTLAVASNCYLIAYIPDDGGDSFFQNVSSYRSRTASHQRICHSSKGSSFRKVN
jgi:hypothetical protein